jgi:hypothetical protein
MPHTLTPACLPDHPHALESTATKRAPILMVFMYEQQYTTTYTSLCRRSEIRTADCMTSNNQISANIYSIGLFVPYYRQCNAPARPIVFDRVASPVRRTGKTYLSVDIEKVNFVTSSCPCRITSNV